MSKIVIDNLKATCIVGIKPDERSTPQEVIIDLSLTLDLLEASKSDDVKDTVDYDQLAKDVINFVQKTNFNLLEKLAYEIAKLVKKQANAKEVRVMVKKPAAIKEADYAAVELSL